MEDDGDDGEEELPGIQSIYRVVRALRKDDHGLYNCLASVAHDAAFVADVIAHYPGKAVHVDTSA